MRLAILKHRKIPVTLDFMRVSAIYRFVTHKFSGQEKTPETRSFRGHPERRRPDLNRWILVLQTPEKNLGTL